MAVTITWDATQGGKTLNHALSRGKKFVTGQVDLASSYATGGVSMSIAGLSTVDVMIFDQASGYQFVFDYTNQKIQVRMAGGATNTATIAAGENATQELASDTVVSGWSAVRFLAIGD